jgi:hypothetical protein
MKRIHFILIALVLIGVAVLVTLIVIKNKKPKNLDNDELGDSDINNERRGVTYAGTSGSMYSGTKGKNSTCSCAWQTNYNGVKYCPSFCDLSDS